MSAPLAWSEVRKKPGPGKFTIKTMPVRIAKVGDLWEGVLGEGIDLYDCLQRLESISSDAGIATITHICSSVEGDAR